MRDPAYHSSMVPSQGARLALLLLGGFNAMVDEVVAELERQGHPGVRPAHEFALRAIDGGADTAAAVARRLAVTKQAAAKTITALEQLGYVQREADPEDKRRKRLRVTPRGREMTAIGAALFDDVRNRWAAQIGNNGLHALEDHLHQLVGDRPLEGDGLAGAGDGQGGGERHPTTATRR